MLNFSNLTLVSYVRRFGRFFWQSSQPSRCNPLRSFARVRPDSGNRGPTLCNVFLTNLEDKIFWTSLPLLCAPAGKTPISLIWMGSLLGPLKRLSIDFELA